MEITTTPEVPFYQIKSNLLTRGELDELLRCVNTVIQFIGKVSVVQSSMTPTGFTYKFEPHLQTSSQDNKAHRKAIEKARYLCKKYLVNLIVLEMNAQESRRVIQFQSDGPHMYFAIDRERMLQRGGTFEELVLLLSSKVLHYIDRIEQSSNR